MEYDLIALSRLAISDAKVLFVDSTAGPLFATLLIKSYKLVVENRDQVDLSKRDNCGGIEIG